MDKFPPKQNINNISIPAIILVLFGAISAVWVASFLFMSTVPLSGDEVNYANSARHFSLFLRGDKTLSELVSVVVGYGWFMPGPSIVLAPLFVIDPHPSLYVIRLYSSVLVYLLWIFTLREVNNIFGREMFVAVLIIPAANLTWQLFSSTVWGDLAAGLLLIIILTKIYTLATRPLEGENISVMDILRLEAIFMALIYLRGNMFVIGFVAHIILFVICVLAANFKTILFNARALIIGFLALILSILPWSITSSTELKGWVFTTTTPVLSLGVTFGDEAKLCFGPCPAGNIWVQAARFSRDYARKNSISELDVQREMTDAALQNISAATYFPQVKKNFSNFLESPNTFSLRFFKISDLKLSIQSIQGAEDIFNGWAKVTYYPFLLALFIANILIIKQGSHYQILSLFIKVSTFCLFIQPFIHPCHGRYWTSFAPLMGLSAGLIYCVFKSNFTTGNYQASNAHSSLLATKGLLYMQILYLFFPVSLILLYLFA